MKTPSLLPFLSQRETGVRVFCLYGSRTDVIAWRMYAIKTLLKLTRPGLKISSVAEVPSPTPSLWGPPPSGNLYLLEKTLAPKEMPRVLALDGYLLFTHGSLTSKSPLLKEFETHPKVAFVACYEAAFSEIERFIAFLQERVSLRFTSEALAFLRLVAADHLEFLPDLFDKLLLLQLPQIEKVDLEALLPCDLTQKNHTFLEAFLAPDRGAFIRCVGAFSQKEDNAFLLMRQLLGMVKQFHEAYTRMGDGLMGGQALKNQRYPLFFGREGVLSQALARHTSQSLTALLTLFWEMEKDQKSDTPGLVVGERKLLQAHALFHGGQDATKTMCLVKSRQSL